MELSNMQKKVMSVLKTDEYIYIDDIAEALKDKIKIRTNIVKTLNELIKLELVYVQVDAYRYKRAI